MKKSMVIFISGLILSAPVMAFARWGNSCWSGGSMPGRGGWFGDYFFGGGMFMFAGTLLIAGLASYFGLHYFKTKKLAEAHQGNPMEILKLRFARGEISREVFERMRDDIR